MVVPGLSPTMRVILIAYSPTNSLLISEFFQADHNFYITYFECCLLFQLVGHVLENPCYCRAECPNYSNIVNHCPLSVFSVVSTVSVARLLLAKRIGLNTWEGITVLNISQKSKCYLNVTFIHISA